MGGGVTPNDPNPWPEENKGSKWVYETCFRLFIYDENMENLKKREKRGGKLAKNLKSRRSSNRHS